MKFLINLNQRMKRIIAILFVISGILMSISLAKSVTAMNETNYLYGGQFATYIPLTTSYDATNGVLMRRIVSSKNYSDIKTVFCIDRPTPFPILKWLNATLRSPNSNDEIVMAKIAYYGWYEKYGNYIIFENETLQVRKDYAYTQAYIWEATNQSPGTFVNPTYQKEYENYKANIQAKIDKMEMKPSFNLDTIELNVGDTIILTDSNKVLKDYNSIDKVVNGIHFEHTKGENTLTITIKKECPLVSYSLTRDLATEWNFIKEETKDHDTTIVYIYSDASVQNQIYSANYNSPVALEIKLKIHQKGDLLINKTNNQKELIDGAKVNVTNQNGYDEDVVVENGEIVLEDLLVGCYTIKGATRFSIST